MRKIYSAFLFLIVAHFGYSQEETPSLNQEAYPVLKQDDALFNTSGIDKLPEYPGGMTAFYSFIAANYKSPDTKGRSGKVFLTFVIEKDGGISHIKVLRDIGYGSGDEAKRVLRECKNWIPGEKDGKKVRVLYSLPIQIGTK